MIIIGIDPGLATIGFGVLSNNSDLTALEFGTIKTPTGIPLELRLQQIFEQVKNLIQKYSPDCLAVERLFFNKNLKTAMTVSKASGVIFLAAAVCGVKVLEYTPLQIKAAICGFGRAKKAEVGFMVKELLGLDKVGKDAGDALACALCHLISRQMLAERT